MKQWQSILLGIIIGSGAPSAVMLTQAAVGDQVYEAHTGRQDITGPQAACYADCAIAAGTWDGNRADMTMACASKKPDGGFEAWTVGLKSAAPNDVPLGVRIVDRVVE